MRRLIINADDLGISLDVNQQIEKFICGGIITSSTLIANAPAFDDGVRIAKQYSQISVGVHLNIIEFAPLTNVDVFKRHGIIDEVGFFIKGAIFSVQVDDELKQAIYEEWDAQISKVEEAGIIPSHCDSHQHAHTIPALQDTLGRVLDKHGINKIRRKIVPSFRLWYKERRNPTIHIVNRKSKGHEKRSILARCMNLLVVSYRYKKWNRKMSNKYIMADFFYSFQNFYAYRKALQLGSRTSVIELMCHPGHKDYYMESKNLLSISDWNISKYKLVTYRELDD